METYYFPKINKKFDRHPVKPVLKATPIPKHPGEIIHIDIHKIEGNLTLAAIDEFSKYAKVKQGSKCRKIKTKTRN